MKEIHFSLTVRITLRETDARWLEAELLEQRTQLFLQALHRVVPEIEAAVLEEAHCPTCHGSLIGNGRVPLVLETPLGRREYARQRCRCVRCGADVYPLDPALGLRPGTGSALGARERALWAVTEVSYAKPAAFLAKFTGPAVSHGRIHTWVRGEGQHLETQEAAQQAATFGSRPTTGPAPLGPPRLYLQADGTLVRQRDAGHMECKVGIAYSQRAQVSRNRIALLDKRTYASFDDAATLGERFWLPCAVAGAATARQIVFVSDGAEWIHTLQQAYFPGALVTPDPWHLEQRLWEVWGAGRPRLVATCRAATWRGDVGGLQRQLRLARARARDPDHRAQVDGHLGYVAANAEGIRNLARFEATGSEAAEKTMDVVMTHRYKKRGMSWRRPGSRALLKLWLLRLNGARDAYWAARRAWRAGSITDF